MVPVCPAFPIWLHRLGFSVALQHGMSMAACLRRYGELLHGRGNSFATRPIPIGDIDGAALDVDTLAFTAKQDNRQVLAVDLGEPAAVPELEAFFYALVPTLRAPPRLVRAEDGHFMDKPDNVLSLINLATVRSLEERWGYAIDPLRFRANFYFDGSRPWEEFDWVGSDIGIGDAILRVDRRNGRCSATNVNPASGERDLDLPGSLRATFGHKDLRVYLVVREGGKVVVGDAVTVPDHVSAAAPPPAPPPFAGQRRFICRGCYYIYDEAIGAPQAGVAPETPFAEISIDWRCPDCGTDKGMFRPYVALSAASPVIRSSDQSR